LLQALKRPSRYVELAGEQRDRGRLPVTAHGKQHLGEAFLAAGSMAHCRLLVRVPPSARKHSYDIAVSQSFRGEEVGRITWRLAALDGPIAYKPGRDKRAKHTK
jgi:hypothetical protein